MDELSINVIIAGRTYPLTIQRDEEELIRSSAKKINDSIKHLQDNYAVRDSQDLLSMAALQVITQLEAGSGSINPEPLIQKINSISQKIDQVLD